MLLQIEPIELDATGEAALIEWLAGQGTGVSSALKADIDEGTKAVPLEIANWQPAPGLVSCGTEIMLVTAIAGGDLTVQCGYLGSTAAPHAQGAMVSELKHDSLEAAVKSHLLDFLRSIVGNTEVAKAPIKAAEAQKEAAVLEVVK